MIDRYTAIQAILRRVNPEDLVLSTTGMISREVFVTSDRSGNFYMIGSMGLLSSFGLGLALQFPEKKVYILEGDGSALMSLGSLPLIATESPKNLFHVILDNEAYESTGSQPSISSKVNLDEMARSSGYPYVARAEDLEALENACWTATPIRPSPDIGTGRNRSCRGDSQIPHPPTEIRDRFKDQVRPEGLT